MSNAALEAGMAVLTPAMDSAEPSQALVAAKCMGLFAGYCARWRQDVGNDAPYQVDDVEAVLTSDLVNPETRRSSRRFSSAGKIDVRATEIATGDKVIFDHKTTSDDISDPSGTYWQQLQIEGQASHYMLLEWMNHNKVDAAIWDVVRKPGISPRQVAKKDVAETLDSGTYCGMTMSDSTLYTFQKDLRETAEMYAARLAQDCTSERPEWYFQRRKVARLDAEIHEYATELWGHGQDILLSRMHDRWPRNSGACMAYGRPCKYLGVCSGHDTIDSERWTRLPYVHKELPVLGQQNGVDILTNSRVRTFQTCRRKHLYQYEMGVERVNEDEAEALAFGALWHSALEAYFNAIMEAQRGS